MSRWVREISAFDSYRACKALMVWFCLFRDTLRVTWVRWNYSGLRGHILLGGMPGMPMAGAGSARELLPVLLRARREAPRAQRPRHRTVAPLLEARDKAPAPCSSRDTGTGHRPTMQTLTVGGTNVDSLFHLERSLVKRGGVYIRYGK